MKKVSNNLDPQAQRWVRNVEDSISNLEKLTAGLAESDRQNAVVVGGVTQAVAEIRAQQDAIILQQQLLAVNTQVDIYDLPTRSTVGLSVASYPLDFSPLVAEYTGLVTFTLSPFMFISGGSGEGINGWLEGAVIADIHRSGGGQDQKLYQPVTGNNIFAGMQDISATFTVADASALTSVALWSDIDSIGGSATTFNLSGVMYVSYNLKRKTT